MTESNYTQIGFNDLLQRDDSLIYVLGATGSLLQGMSAATQDYNGSVEEATVKSDGAMADLWIINTIRSTNWKPQKTGFYMDGATGYAEFANVYISGSIVATTGTIGGFTIGTTTISGGTSLVLSSIGTGIITGGTFRTASSGERIEIISSGGSYSLSAINSSEQAIAFLGFGGPAGSGVIRVIPRTTSQVGLTVEMPTSTVNGVTISGGFYRGLEISPNTNETGSSIYSVGISYPAIEAYQNGTSSNSYGIKVTSGTNALKSGIYVNSIADSNLPFGIYINRVGSSTNDVVGMKIDSSNSSSGASCAIFIGAGGSTNFGIDMSALTTKAYFKVAPNATDPTGGGGAATGRIPILVGATTYYLAYY